MRPDVRVQVQRCVGREVGRRTIMAPIVFTNDLPSALRLQVACRPGAMTMGVSQDLAEVIQSAEYGVTPNGDGSFTHTWVFPVEGTTQ